MCRKTSASFLLVVCLAVGARAADPVRIVVSAGSSTGAGDFLNDAKREFEKRYGLGLIDVVAPGANLTAEQIRRANVIFLAFPEPPVTEGLAGELERTVKGGVPLLLDETQIPRQWTFQPNAEWTKGARLYWQYGGVRNIAGMYAYLYRKAGGAKPIEVPPPIEMPLKGIYHPRANRDFASMEDYLAWYRAQRIVPSDAPLVAITFFSGSVRQGDTAHLDALITELERNGIGAVPVYGWPLYESDPFLTTKDGKCPLSVIFAMNVGMLPRPQDQQWLTDHGVHAMNLEVTQETYQQWETSTTGIPAEMVPWQLATPETFSTAEPILVATTEIKRETGARITVPIPERVEAAVKRAKRWIALQRKPNAEKRIVFVYYNYPPGKGNISAAYLQVFPTMATMLERLAQAGYQLASPVPTPRQLQDVLERRGRNVETWAPGELQAMLDSGGMTLFSVEDYKKYFKLLPERFQKIVMDEYGPPEKAEMLRVRSRDGKDYFLIPGARYGNVLLSVQPLEASFALSESVLHDPLHPVPHSYVAAYLYYRYVFKADAVVHIGRHGTLEWLMGKGVLQAGWDHSEALLGDLPNAYLYLMDGEGEAIQAMRHSASVNMSHLTPLLIAGGEQKDFQTLRNALLQSAEKEATEAALAEEYKKQAFDEVRRLKLDQQLDLKLDGDWPELRKRLQEWLEELQETAIPASMHILGTLPEEQVQRESLLQYLKFGFEDQDLPLVRNEVEAWATAIFEGRQPEIQGSYSPKLRDKIQTQWAAAKTWIEDLRRSPKSEVDALVTVLSGHYLPAAPVGDPLKNPAGLPTGTKQYGFDPALIPTKAAWEVGHRMAEQTLARYKEQHGKYPQKISIVLWYGETIGHHGVMESMALDLMGVRVGWNERNQPDSLTLVPDSEMTHPRVDVVFSISGMYRDGFGEKINFLSRAIRMAAQAGENVISRHDRENAAALIQAGTNATAAGKIAQARFFGPKPGSHDNGVDHFVEQSKNAEDTEGIAKLELSRMAYAYSPDVWGQTAPQALETQLKGNEAVLFSRSSSLVGAIDNDDVYGFVGALSNASKYVNGGQAPDFYLNNLRKSGSERPVDLKTWLATELNQRNWNPKWLEHMKESGYAGARQMADEMEFLYGFQAATPDSMDGTYWQNSFDVYVADKYGMELDKFFEKENPHAKQGILARMLQVDREGSYRFSEADRNKLLAEYVRSVVKNGVACSANICGNEKLQQYVASAAATVPGLGQIELQQFGKTLAKATHWNVTEFRGAPAAVRAGILAANQKVQPRPAAPAKPSGPPHVEGYAMQEKIINLAKEASSPALPFAWAWAAAILLIIATGSALEARRSRRTIGDF